MAVLIPYGLRDGIAIHIREVPSGLACGCVCLNCSTELIARKGNIREDHFAHRSGVECAGLAEGVLHRLAKDTICRLKVFELPEYLWERSKNLPFGGGQVRHRKKLTRAGQIRVVDGLPEYRAPPDFVPDAVLFAESTQHDPKPLFVEVVVTNPVRKLKRRKIRRFGVPTMQILMSVKDLALSPEAFIAKLAGLSSTKTWVFHPGEIECEKSFIEEYRRRRAEALRDIKRQRTKPAVTFRPLIRASKTSGPGSLTAFLESERELQRFHDRHHRYPSLEETRRRYKP